MTEWYHLILLWAGVAFVLMLIGVMVGKNRAPDYPLYKDHITCLAIFWPIVMAFIPLLFIAIIIASPIPLAAYIGEWIMEKIK